MLFGEVTALREVQLIQSGTAAQQSLRTDSENPEHPKGLVAVNLCSEQDYREWDPKAGGLPG